MGRFPGAVASAAWGRSPEQHKATFGDPDGIALKFFASRATGQNGKSPAGQPPCSSRARGQLGRSRGAALSWQKRPGCRAAC
jgi:hypothetical protein